MIALAVAAALAPTAAAAPTTERISVSSDGSQGRRAASMCWPDSITPDGRFVLFYSRSRGLTPGDRPGPDLFVRDRLHGTTTLIPGGWAWCSISSNGRYVAYDSTDSHLVRGDTNEEADVFVRDVKHGTTVRLLRSGGGQIDAGADTPSLSDDGRYLAFTSRSAQLAAHDEHGRRHVYVRDRHRGTTRLLSRGFDGRPANRNVGLPVISGNGRYVAFTTVAWNLVPSDTNERSDVFVYDRVARTIVWSSVPATGGASGPVHHWRARVPRLSASGRYVMFSSDAPNIVADDNDAHVDIFVHDRERGTTQRVSVASGGRAACRRPAGRSGSRCFEGASLSPDGRFAAFTSRADDLVPGDTNGIDDIFVHDTRTRITWRASAGASGEQIVCRSRECTQWSAISAEGRFVVFNSKASIVAGDTNAVDDIFVRGPFEALDQPLG